jgi:hypothetical protein
MTGHSVPDRDMPNFLGPGHRDVPMIGDTSLAALLAGTELPPGAAPELRPLAEALAELRARPASDELEGESETLAAFRSQFGAPQTGHRPPARKAPLLSRSLLVKTAAAAATVLSLSGVAAAAYAGALPAPVQRLAHHIIGALPPGTSQPALTPSPARRATRGDRAYGLCTAWAHAKAHGTHKQQAAAFGRLTAAAGGAGKVTAYCATGAPPGTSPSQIPQPAPTPHGTGRPSGLPAPHGSGKPSGLPTPHRTGAPTVRPTPHSTGKPSGLPTPVSSTRAKSTAAVTPRPM